MIILATVLVLTVFAALWRVLKGPTKADRLLSVQLFGTAGAALMLILASLADQPAFRDAALVLALLAAVVSAALVQYMRQGADQ